MEKAKKFYHFSVDDVFDSLIEVSDRKQKLFDNPFFSYLKKLNETFGTQVDLYLFFQKKINGRLRTLGDVSDSVRREFEKNPWIRFGPHALDYGTAPYNQSPEEQVKIYDKIYNEIYRFSGRKNLSGWVRLHYFSESYELRNYFKEKGVEAIFTTDKDRITTRMPEVNEELKEKGFSYYKGLGLIRSQIRIENLANKKVSKEELKEIVKDHFQKYSHLILFTHEYELERKEVREITRDVLKILSKKNIKSI